MKAKKALLPKNDNKKARRKWPLWNKKTKKIPFFGEKSLIFASFYCQISITLNYQFQ
jgi:hypothetical protein